MIVVEKLTKRFDGRVVLDGIDAEFARGEVSAIVGPSGGGKSTLLRCLNGLERFDAGRLRVFDIELGPIGARGDGQTEKRAIESIRRRVGMVFQHYGLFAHMTALANVMEAPVVVRGLAKHEARAWAEALLARVGLADRRHAFPREMSGGEQQRVAIARALAMDPEALLLDEPTSALDPERKGEVVRALGDLAAAGTTMIIVSHEPALVRDIVTRTLVLRNGRVVSDERG